MSDILSLKDIDTPEGYVEVVRREQGLVLRLKTQVEGFLHSDVGVKTATAAAGAATLHKRSGKITSEALTTAAGGAYALTLTNAKISADDIVLASVANGTNTGGTPFVGRVTPANGSVAIEVRNLVGSALNGSLVVSFAVLKA